MPTWARAAERLSGTRSFWVFDGTVFLPAVSRNAPADAGGAPEATH
jgi:hypothetical protein